MTFIELAVFQLSLALEIMHDFEYAANTFAKYP